MDNCSATSTYLTDSLELELGTEWCRPPCFSCAFDNRGGGKHFSGESYLASGALKRLILNLDPLPTNFEEDTVEIFGIQWVTETALVNSSRVLFHLFRQQLYNLETLLPASCDFGKISTLHCKADNIRQQCVTFLHYVKVFIARFLTVQNTENHGPVHPYEVLEAQLPSLLVDELHGLLLYIGHLSELPSINPGAFISKNQIQLFPPSWHLLHLHLDIHWLVLEILQMLGVKLKHVVYGHQFMNLAGDNLTNVSLFEEHCENLLCDLISLSLNRYDKVRAFEALTSDHCPCPCIKELWVLLIHLLDQRSKWSLSEPFWNWLNKLLKTLFETSSEQRKPVPAIQSRDPLGFSWWIITHVASLYQFDRHGAPDEMRQMESNWNFVEELLKRSINVQDGILEEQLRMYLHCCLTLCDFWEPNITIVTILWEYYSKNLNSSFSISWLPLKGLTNIIKSPLSMLEMVKTCCCDKQDYDLCKSRSSYTIFLCILAKVVKKAMKNNSPHPWKQVKGRIYSKFHQKRMEELTVVGLQNFFNLFLLLAAVAEVEDVAIRVLDLLNFLKPTLKTSPLIWKGQAAFLLMYTQKNVDIGVLAEKFSDAFQAKAREFLVSKNDEMGQRQTLWTLLSIYIDGVQEVFETSQCLHPSHEKLLNDGFSMLLPACQEPELRTVLYFLQAVLARIRNMHQQLCQELRKENVGLVVQSSLLARERHLAAVASALWRHFFSFLKGQRMSQAVPSSQLADAAADFTLLAMDMPSTAPSDLQPQPVKAMIQLFGWDDIICPQVAAKYLSHFLQNSMLCEALSYSGCVSFQALTIRSWIRCILQMYIKSLSLPDDLIIDINLEQAVEKEYMEQLSELTRLLFKLSEVKNIFSEAQVEYVPTPEDPKRALIQFLEAVGITYRNLQKPSDKSAMVKKSLEYLGEILKYIKPYLGKKISSAGLQLTYRMMGILVKSWAQIFATAEAQKLLFRIIDCLLLPHSVLLQEKELPAPLLTAIQKSLPLYLQGMCIVCGQSQNAYLNQLLGNVIEQYIRRFLPASPQHVLDLGQHPVLLALRNSATLALMPSLKKCIVQVIRKSYLESKPILLPPRLASILAFILQLFKETNMDVSEVEQLLPGVLKCLVLVSESQVKRLATENLQCMVKTCQAGSEGEPAAQLTAVFRHFIQDYGMRYDNQIYSILETVAALDQQVVIHLIPTLTQTLKDSEQKWGLGRNMTQRKAYSKLLSHLGQVGQDEMQRLENENN
ncbi:protein MMS22-like isoform X1 [Myotis myotis]|uniref:Protein MMS22-like n=3 Tax=Myotis myotis TaxID=51298 RepID=A0A7J7WWT0_MYOMY|nr:protein MMS22-like isoform X1 [Myotis myotis]XP_036173300.1 protein MMS22-like isoform X1 [Myotis myotis]XP_036173301.1 protein MMS22-like isoform X1 [Myotis myotis]KAF6341676.1 MMS22 like, DNA repair protein [Myotis myotis]